MQVLLHGYVEVGVASGQPLPVIAERLGHGQAHHFEAPATRVSFTLESRASPSQRSVVRVAPPALLRHDHGARCHEAHEIIDVA